MAKRKSSKEICGARPNKDFRFTNTEMRDLLIKHIDSIRPKVSRTDIRNMKREQLCRYFKVKEATGTKRLSKLFNTVSDESTQRKQAKKSNVGGKVKITTYKTPKGGCVHGVQGKRPEMEDAHAVANDGVYEYYGVFDGHGGDNVSKVLASKLFPFVSKYIKGVNKSSEVIDKIKKAFLQFDYNLWNEDHNMKAGSTATVAIFKRSTGDLYIVNVGDSRTVVFDVRGTILYHTIDHNTYNDRERERVMEDNKINGSPIKGFFAKPVIRGVERLPERLNRRWIPTRSFGDFDGKNVNETYLETGASPMTALPGIRHIKLDEVETSRTYILLACDGLWDVYDNKQAIEVVRKMEKPQKSCKELTDSALQKGSEDNVSVMLVNL